MPFLHHLFVCVRPQIQQCGYTNVSRCRAESPVQLDIKCNEDFTTASHARTEMQLLRSKSINAIYWTALIAVYLHHF